MYEERVRGLGDQGYNLKEERAWKEVESQFNTLKKYMRNQYGQ